MRIYPLIMLTVVSCCLLSCSNQNKIDRKHIIYWASNNTDEITFAGKIVNQWNNGNTGSKVTFQPVPEGQSSEEVILAAVVGNTRSEEHTSELQSPCNLVC